MPRRRARLGLLVVLLPGCAGASSFEACVQHSVEEGVDRGVVERACLDAGDGD
jgi:hypothetical protein